VLAGLWLCAPQPAKAGGGAGDFSSLQAAITNNVCPVFGIDPCPQLPTLTQAVLELAALWNAPQGMVRSGFNVSVGNNIDAGNPSRPPAQFPYTITGFPVDASVLFTLQPLAFVGASSSTGVATPTYLNDPSATAFLYAVGGVSALNAGSPQPDTLVLLYDASKQPSPSPAKISLPLTVLNSDGSERAVAAVLRYGVSANNDCSASVVVGDFKGTGNQQTLAPAQIGVNCAAKLASSPASTSPHAVFEVAVPLLLTGDGTSLPGSKSTRPNTDPAYFYTDFFCYYTKPSPQCYPYSPVAQPFLSNEYGSVPGGNILGSKGIAIGIAPTAGPLGAPSKTTAAIYSLCASLPNGEGAVPSVAAFYAIATNGEVLLSTPLAPARLASGVPSIVCPAM
jgi:hypothetical protein